MPLLRLAAGLCQRLLADDSAMILDEIVAHKSAVELPFLPPVDRSALRGLPPTLGFRAALARPKDKPIRVIAECKKGSPSRGIFAPNYDPVLIAYQYLLGGASCLSVLTDEHFFFGHLDHLIAVRAAVTLPIIRKDFILDARQIAQARIAGADAVLLIVACLEDGELRDLHGFARELDLDVLIEVHNVDEAARALKLGAAADLIGINNRNLQDFSLTLDTTYGLLSGLKAEGRVLVSESGIHERSQCRDLEAAGVDAVLIGESLMTAKEPDAALHILRGTFM